MKQYMILYFGGDHPSDSETRQKHFAKYQQWLNSLGNSVVKAMVPFVQSNTVNPNGVVQKGSATALSGFTILQAETTEQVIEYAQSCPFLEINGKLEVAEMPEILVTD